MRNFEPARWWRLLISAAWLIWLSLAAYDAYTVSADTGTWLGGFSRTWFFVFLVALAGFLALLILGLAVLWRPRSLQAFVGPLIALRQKLGWARGAVLAALLVIPAWACCFLNRQEHWTLLLDGPVLRQLLALFMAVGAGYLLTRDRARLIDLSSAVSGLLLVAFAFSAMALFVGVSDYPFSVTWSEGNRLYDYSLVFGQDRYNYDGPIASSYSSPLRYALWGIPFLWRDLPILYHRIWDAVLYIAPVLLVAWLIVRTVRPAALRWMLAVGLMLFLNQGPIYPHLLAPLILLLLFLYHPNWYVRAASLVAASILICLARWTWAIGPGVWGALVDLFLYYPARKGNLVQRLLPTAGLGLAGALPGLLFAWLFLFSSPSTGSMTAGQPLLWYRLFPNPTNPLGILAAALLASLPVIIWLAWLWLSRRCRVDWVQVAAVIGALAGLFVMGILVSLKIGGGNNLHNLDLFLVTVAILVGLVFRRADAARLAQWRTYPGWMRLVLVLALVIPSFQAVSLGAYLALPDKTETQLALRLINNRVASVFGEVLFMDQRQLLTFGYVPAVPLIPEYEKKYMMDQAMAGDAAYFAGYYRDLAAGRFELIVTEHLTDRVEDPARDDFAEETNAWLRWVAAPTLCYYQPVVEIQPFSIDLLVPRADTSACDRYLVP